MTEDGNLQCWAQTGASQAQRMRSFTIAVNGDAGSVYKGLAITLFATPLLQCTQMRSDGGFSATPGGIKTVFVRFL